MGSGRQLRTDDLIAEEARERETARDAGGEPVPAVSDEDMREAGFGTQSAGAVPEYADEERDGAQGAASRADEPREEAAAGAEEPQDGPLLDGGESQRFTGRWEAIQIGFVDEPRRSVEEADALVAELMQQLAGTFAAERRSLEGQWDRGDGVSTEELRMALRRYRSFFSRLLAA